MGKKIKKEQPELHLEIFVSGLPYTSNEDDLKEFFASDAIV